MVRIRVAESDIRLENTVGFWVESKFVIAETNLVFNLVRIAFGFLDRSAFFIWGVKDC